MSGWTPAFALEDLPRGQARLLKTESHRVAVFRLEDGEIFAVDNACPHEGYPLVQGEIRDRVLTCAWHNFKFSLESGSCLKGDEDVQNYSTRVVDGQIEVELTAPDPQRVIERARQSLEEGMREAQQGRMAREVVRLLTAGVPAREILADGAVLDARYAEYGTTHALPVAVDLHEYLTGEVEHDTQVIMLLLELVADPSLRRPRQNWAPPQQSDDFARDLSVAIEGEDVDGAIGLVRGALPVAGPPEVAGVLIACASEHFLGFGHGLIYATKVAELLEQDSRHAEEILCALTLRVLSSTREDVLPPMARWRSWVNEHGPELQRGDRGLDGVEVDRLAQRIVDPADREIEADFLALLLGGTDTSRLVDVLVEAAALRLLRFDPAIHEDWSVQDNWLSVTHPLTFAHAIRDALDRTGSPAVLANLVWSLAFTRRGHRLDMEAAALPRPVASKPGDLIAALDLRDGSVVERALGWDGEYETLAPPLRDWLLAGQATLPIYIAHQIKTARVALQERRTRVPLLATLRYLGSPVAERSLRSVVHDAVQLVVHGNLPKRRAS